MLFSIVMVAMLMRHVRLRVTVRLTVVGVSLDADHCENGGDHSQADCGVEAIERFRRLSASPF
jgi:hypothetical protein